MKKFFKVLFLIIALILAITLYLFLLILNIPFLIKDSFRIKNDYFKNWAYLTLLGIDLAGALTFYPIWNALWVKNDRLAPFGIKGQTISVCLKKNKNLNNLTWFGELWVRIINLIFKIVLGQKNHIQESK